MIKEGDYYNAMCPIVWKMCSKAWWREFCNAQRKLEMDGKDREILEELMN